ncbi:MAG: type II toxin-antitoxin system Phd/YefM family antitoxin [Myxococcales bacterium]|nr:type II toxin-antitoxin system Phd/YefM family antitoxin [Myxococcales bacterium]
MVRRARVIPAGEFKAKCLALLDDVAATGQPIVVSKRGKPVAKIVPVDDQEVPDLRGSVLAESDLISPVDVPWDAAR